MLNKMATADNINKDANNSSIIAYLYLHKETKQYIKILGTKNIPDSNQRLITLKFMKMSSAQAPLA